MKLSTISTELSTGPALALELAYPPTVNHYYCRSRDGRLYVAQAGVVYRRAVMAAAWAARGSAVPMLFRMRVEIALYPPDRRRRDLDNTLKALLDALTWARVWHDDEQIDDLRIVRGPVAKGGAALVTIWPAR